MRAAPALAGSLECSWRRKTEQIKEGDRDIRTTCGGEKKEKEKRMDGKKAEKGQMI